MTRLPNCDRVIWYGVPSNASIFSLRIASFKATLEEARQARLLLHVVDASSPHAEEHIDAVNKVLQELGCDKQPTLLVLNKVDRVVDPSILHVLQKRHRRSVAISAATGLKPIMELSCGKNTITRAHGRRREDQRVFFRRWREARASGSP